MEISLNNLAETLTDFLVWPLLISLSRNSFSCEERNEALELNLFS